MSTYSFVKDLEKLRISEEDIPTSKSLPKNYRGISRVDPPYTTKNPITMDYSVKTPELHDIVGHNAAKKKTTTQISRFAEHIPSVILPEKQRIDVNPTREVHENLVRRYQYDQRQVNRAKRDGLTIGGKKTKKSKKKENTRSKKHKTHKRKIRKYKKRTAKKAKHNHTRKRNMKGRGALMSKNRVVPINTTPRPVISENWVKKSQVKDDKCVLCLEPLSKPGIEYIVYQFPCGHQYHVSCLYNVCRHSLITRDFRCPICRTEYPVDKHCYYMKGVVNLDTYFVPRQTLLALSKEEYTGELTHKQSANNQSKKGGTRSPQEILNQIREGRQQIANAHQHILQEEDSLASNSWASPDTSMNSSFESTYSTNSDDGETTREDISFEEEEPADDDDPLNQGFVLEEGETL